MKLQIKSRKHLAVAAFLFSVIIWWTYLLTQNPKVWCDREWAGIMLLKGGYRSWTMRFCDGRIYDDGKLVPVVVTDKGYRKGYFWFPRFYHVDVRRLLTHDPSGTNNIRQVE